MRFHGRFLRQPFLLTEKHIPGTHPLAHFTMLRMLTYVLTYYYMHASPWLTMTSHVENMRHK